MNACRLLPVSLFLVIVTLVAGGADSAPKPHLDSAAPELTAVTIDNKPATLNSLRDANKDKIIILQFASLSDPVFRAHIDVVEKLATASIDKAAFVIMYQKEAHAAASAQALELNKTDGFDVAVPKALDDRIALAKQMIERLQVKSETVLVDAMSDASSTRYGGLPNMTFVIDARGVLRAAYPFMDAARVKYAIDMIAQGKELSPELEGPQNDGPSPFDAAGAAMDMTGTRGPATIAAILDRVNLTFDQRQALLPAVADFVADVQTFRQVRAAVPDLPGPRGARSAPNPPARANAATAPARGAPPGQQADSSPKTLQDLQNAQDALHTSAAHLQMLIHQTLPEKDASALIDALSNMVPAQRLFSH